MLKPIDNWRYIVKNFEILKRDYNWLNLTVCFLVIPFAFALLFTSFLDIPRIIAMLKDSITFFSIIIGFLINALVYILLNKSSDEKATDNKKLEKIEKLKESLGYNILNLIILSSVFLILILFYNFYPNAPIYILTWKLNIVELILVFLFLETIMLFFNIIRKFGAYIETKYTS